MQRHALAAALFAALSLSACQSTTPTESEVAAKPIGQAGSTPLPPPPPVMDPEPAPMDAHGELDRVEVTGTRVRRQSRMEAKQFAANAPPMEAAMLAAPSAIAPQPAGYRQPSNTEKYAERTDNPIHRASEQPVSTFSIDVDTGSYANVRRMLRQGVRPPADSVRAEEFINYFDYGHPAPTSLAVPFRTTTELGSAPWNPKRQLLMIGIKGYDVPKAELPPANLVFLIDTSGSMDEPDKLPLLKQSFSALTSQLRAQDRVSIVVYAGSAGLVLPPTPGDRRDEILGALERLEAGGSTNGGAGIQLAYAMAKQAYMPKGVNRVILATDGDFNVGTVDQGSPETYVGDQRKHGIA